MIILKILLLDVVFTLVSVVSVGLFTPGSYDLDEVLRNTEFRVKALGLMRSITVPIWFDVIIEVIFWPVIIALSTIDLIIRCNEYHEMKTQKEGAA